MEFALRYLMMAMLKYGILNIYYTKEITLENQSWTICVSVQFLITIEMVTLPKLIAWISRIILSILF